MTGTDPYVPGHGDGDIDVSHYDLDLTYSPASNLLRGEATIDLTVLSPLRRFRLDLRDLSVRGVKLQGAALGKYAHKNGHLTFALRGNVDPGEKLRVTVSYSGNPRPTRARHLGEAGWEELTDGVIVASQPHGAPSWFPCNDSASDKATYRVTLTAPADYAAAFSGATLADQRRGASRVWTFTGGPHVALSRLVANRPVSRNDPGGRPRGKSAISVLHPRNLDAPAFAASFGRQVEMMACFEDHFGDYPFTRYRSVITDDPLEIPLESQELSTFGHNHCSAEWEAERLVAHEMSHSGLATPVTAEQWRDIWLHEGFACYSEWLWSQSSGRRSIPEWARFHYDRLVSLPQDIVVGNPGAEHMFDDRVYKRGALTVYALRCLLGDAAFYPTITGWIATHRGGCVNTAGFAEYIGAQTGSDVTELLRRWLYESELPAFPG